MNRVIALDFDDVICDTNTALALFHNAHYGTNLTRADIFSWHLEDVWHCTLEEAIRRVGEFLVSPEHDAARPVPGAIEGMRELKRLGYRIVIVTSRADSVIPQTEAWFKKHIDGLYDDVHYTNHFDAAHHKHRTKAEVCMEIGAEVLVEDAPHHAEGVAEAGTRVLLMDAPWNQMEFRSTNITRVKSWGEIVNWVRTSLPL